MTSSIRATTSDALLSYVSWTSQVAELSGSCSVVVFIFNVVLLGEVPMLSCTCLSLTRDRSCFLVSLLLYCLVFSLSSCDVIKWDLGRLLTVTSWFRKSSSNCPCSCFAWCYCGSVLRWSSLGTLLTIQVHVRRDNWLVWWLTRAISVKTKHVS